MPLFNWLHITDIHLGTSGQKWKWPDVKADFLDDLEKVTKWSGKLDLVLLTGDLVFSGQKFDRAENLISEFFSFLAKSGHTPLLLAVPGNHDLKRPKKLSAAQMNLAKWDQHPEAQKEFWEDEKSVHRREIVKLFQGYEAWWSKQPASKLPLFRHGPLPGDFSFTLEKEGARLGIVGFNSTFLQFQGGPHEGKLALSAQQFHAAHKNNDGAAWIKEHHACLLMTHQPRSWLNPEAQAELDRINSPGRFVVHLFGHMHEFDYENRSWGSTVPKRFWQGDSLFGLEYYKDENGREEQRSHGYSVGQICIESRNVGTIRFWPRKAQKLPSGNWVFGPVPSHFKLDEEHGNCTEPNDFPLIREFSSLIPSATPFTPESHVVQGQLAQEGFPGLLMIAQQEQYPEPILISQSTYRRETQDEIEERTEITYRIPRSLGSQEGGAAIPALNFGGYSITEPTKGMKAGAIGQTFVGISGRPPIQLFKQLLGAPPGMPMVKAGLDTPSLQRGFFPTGMHTKFLAEYDPTRSYCFRTGEKTGKTSWLGYLAQHLISDFDQEYEPVWVNTIPESFDAYAIITDFLTRQKDHFHGHKPILFVDNIHLQPSLIAAIPRLRASKSVWKEVPICCTYLRNPPEKESWRAAWDESKGVWPKAAEFFEERRDVPGHVTVSDKDGKLTEDGKTLIEAVAKHLDRERADLLRPVFEEPQREIPYAWLAFYVVENFSRGGVEAEQWIYENRAKMAPETLYQVTWSGSERHQDIIRAAAFLSPTARDLLVQFCSRLRQEPEEHIEEHIDRILELGDIWEKDEDWPFSHDKGTCFEMPDGLTTLGLMPENFSKASHQRYRDTLLECVAPGTKAGERAAILATAFALENGEFRNRLCERFAKADLSSAGESFLFCPARFVEEFDSAETVHALAQAMLAKTPPRLRTTWAGALSSVRARLKDLRTDVISEALYEKVVSTLELEWNEEGDSAEAGVALANFYMEEKSWDQALSWWERVGKRSEDHRDAANVRIVQCLLKAGEVEEAERRSKAIPETAELEIVWAEHFEKTHDWEKAIDKHRRVAQEYSDYRAAALERIGNLYRDKFDPCRIDEAKDAYEESFEADNSRPSPLIGLVTLYEKTEQWKLAAEVLERIGNEFKDHRDAANVRIVQCLLKAGEVEEAERRSKAIPETAELEIVWAEHFEKTHDWEKAIDKYRRVAQEYSDYRAAALERIGNLYRDKFDPCRIDEAKDAYEESFEADNSRPSPLIGLVTLYEKTEQWKLAAEVLERIGNEFKDHRDAANVRIVQCLLKAGEVEEAERRSKAIPETAELD